MLGASYMRLFALFGICVSFARLATADVTVDGIAPLTDVVALPTPAASISIIGVASLSVQSNGATVYVETEVETQFAFISGTSTQTLFSTPTTIVATFAEDASFYSLTAAATTTFNGNVIVVGDELVCSGTRGAEVTCVQEDVQSVGGQVQTATATISALRMPAFTIKSSAARALSPAAVMSLTAAVGVVCATVFKGIY
ncbi:hypothetical protein HYPSUDRAFT_209704 [Hypholoma sublateritium FD-334 SS-4]|uniref:Uncharacterized protein n=1 Tax=Hypholoma sublateritium (strain FD-334 SS-4) TaxID=945553 RepID=A0A0D2LR21_HYPSF|nr:hypothetical protein HYPSUDRAFT_209704 [Hypholoma sublateritium FD-334 SS-4]